MVYWLIGQITLLCADICSKGLSEYFNSSWVTLLLTNQPCLPASVSQWRQRFFSGYLRVIGLLTIAALCLLAPQRASSQDSATPAETRKKARQPVESELIVEGEGQFGHVHFLTCSWWSYLYTGGVEYDRHSWGNFIGARMDYVAEVLPVAILRQPTVTDVWGDPLTQTKEIVPGAAISPIGLRMMWRSNKSIKPYFISKGGLIFFDKKALSQYASYGNMILQVSIGLQFRVTKRVDLRAGAGYMHFSDAFVVPSNPGLDVMNYNGGLSYHIGK